MPLPCHAMLVLLPCRNLHCASSLSGSQQEKAASAKMSNQLLRSWFAGSCSFVEPVVSVSAPPLSTRALSFGEWFMGSWEGLEGEAKVDDRDHVHVMWFHECGKGVWPTKD